MSLPVAARSSARSMAMMASAAGHHGVLEGRARQFEMAARALVGEFGRAFSPEYVERVLGGCVAEAVSMTDDPDLVSWFSFRAARTHLRQAEQMRTRALGGSMAAG